MGKNSDGTLTFTTDGYPESRCYRQAQWPLQSMSSMGVERIQILSTYKAFFSLHFTTDVYPESRCYSQAQWPLQSMSSMGVERIQILSTYKAFFSLHFSTDVAVCFRFAIIDQTKIE